jgi:hypothetical protein
VAKCRLVLPELPRQLSLRTLDEKQAAFGLVAKHIHSNIPANRHLPELLLSNARVSDESLIAEQFTSLDVLRKLASDRLVTIGGYTVHRCTTWWGLRRWLRSAMDGGTESRSLILVLLISCTHTGQAQIVVSENSLWLREQDL